MSDNQYVSDNNIEKINRIKTFSEEHFNFLNQYYEDNSDYSDLELTDNQFFGSGQDTYDDSFNTKSILEYIDINNREIVYNYYIFIWKNIMNNGGYAFAIAKNKKDAISQLIKRFHISKSQYIRSKKNIDNYSGKIPLSTFGSVENVDDLYVDFVTKLNNQKCIVMPCRNFSCFFA